MGDLIYPRYILVSRDKTTLALVRMYDISQPANVTLVQDYLMKERQAWEDRCAIDKKYMKRDVIGIPESVLTENLLVTQKLTIDNCTVIRA